MTYSVDTPILGRGTTSAEAVQAWFAAQGRRYAPSYGPGGQYVPPPDGLGRAIVEECQRYAGQTVGWDMVAGQIVHETAGWQSAYARERNNPGGIGAINSDPDQAIRFASVADGVRAHVAHLLAYAVGDGPWRGDDPRFAAVARAGWLGVASRWRDLNGRWAWPGETYADSIASLANDLVAFANDGPWEKPEEPVTTLTPPPGWKPPEIVRRILPRDASNTPQKRMDWQFVVVHNTGNPSPGADALAHANWLEKLAREGADEPSWGYTVDDTRIVQHLEDDQCGWHALDGDGPGNMRGIGFELVEVGDQELVLWNAGWLIGMKLRQRGYGMERVGQHHQYARDQKDCPRLLRANGGAGWRRLLAIIDQFRRGDEPAAPADPVRVFSESGHGIGGGFRWFWEHNGGLPIFGYPLTDELTDPETGRTIQWFERACFEYHPENPPEWQVLLRRLGAEALARREEDAA